tara:strand:- start:31 stop:357 length:327 start_codon:yes stop_codon:yes gene_type:complete
MIKLIVFTFVLALGACNTTHNGKKPGEFENFQDAKFYCINQVSGPVRVELINGGVLGAAIVGALSGLQNNWVETGTRPVYEDCMAQYGYQQEALEERPDDYVSPAPVS